MTTTDHPDTVEFFFDPGCPWTWMTSRWLVEAADRRGLEIRWRSLSLGVLNEGNEIPEAYRAAVAAAGAAHRVLAALSADGRNDLAGAFYTEYGRRAHHDGEAPSLDLVRAVAEASGAAAWAEAATDESWDAAVRESTHLAVDLAGPDVGSPVLAFGDPRVAFFGPIVSPPPTGGAADRLLDHVVDLATIPDFFELKRGRRSGPRFGPRP